MLSGLFVAGCATRPRVTINVENFNEQDIKKMEINGISGYWMSDDYIDRIDQVKINMIGPSKNTVASNPLLKL